MAARQFSGRALREARTSAGIRIEQLALDVGRSYYSIRQYESGDRSPSAAGLAALADRLGVTTDSLYEEVSDVVAA